jgi:hypothetical protein
MADDDRRAVDRESVRHYSAHNILVNVFLCTATKEFRISLSAKNLCAVLKQSPTSWRLLVHFLLLPRATSCY